MHIPWRSLKVRFALAGCLLVMATLASSLFSSFNFARLSRVVDDALRESQQAIDLATDLSGSLEREDDALLLAISNGRDRAPEDLRATQRRSDEGLARLVGQLQRGDSEEQRIAQELGDEIRKYRVAAAALLARSAKSEALTEYHAAVNPFLRQAVATCARIREINFRTMERAGIHARDAASRATTIVTGITATAFVLGCVVTVWLARSIIRPVRDLTRSVEAVRQGDFDRRAGPAAVDELGNLAEGFNRMAETVGEYRRSSVGELLASKTTLEASLNALPDAVIVISPDGGVANSNPPARAVLAATGRECALHFQDLPLSTEQKESIAAALAGRASIPSRADFGKVLAIAVEGRPRRFAVAVVPIPEFAPRRFGAVIVLNDVTEVARLDEMRTELIGVASHELKTPLTALRMNLMLLGEEAQLLGQRNREMLSAALAGSEELESTIDELLDMTRIEAGQLRLDLAPVDLGAILGRVQARLQPRFDDARVAYRLTADDGPAIAQGDAARLTSVFTNILVNALKYSPQGATVTVSITSGAFTPAGAVSRQIARKTAAEMLQVAVTDAGPGIPVECREKVFEKFFRVEHQRGDSVDGVRGTGIGLYLCREIVRAHGGAIWCEAGDAGVGTRVALRIPRAGSA